MKIRDRILCDAEFKMFGTIAATILWWIRMGVKSKEARADDYFGSKGHRHGVFWAYDTIADMAIKIGYSRRALCKYIKMLEDEEYIIIDRHCTSQGIRQHFYRINPERDLYRRPQKSACENPFVHSPPLVLKTNSNPIVTSHSNSDSYIEKMPIEGAEQQRLISHFEEKFKTKVTINERNRFKKNIASNPNITAEKLLADIDFMHQNDLIRISTTSLNRVFYADDLRRIFEMGHAEIRNISEACKIGFSATFQTQRLQALILKSNFARKNKLTRPSAILKYALNLLQIEDCESKYESPVDPACYEPLMVNG